MPWIPELHRRGKLFWKCIFIHFYSALNNESGKLRFHTVDKYLLNAGRQFSGARQFVHQVDLVGLGVPWCTQVYPGVPRYTQVYPGVPRCTQVYLVGLGVPRCTQAKDMHNKILQCLFALLQSQRTYNTCIYVYTHTYIHNRSTVEQDYGLW